MAGWKIKLFTLHLLLAASYWSLHLAAQTPDVSPVRADFVRRLWSVPVNSVDDQGAHHPACMIWMTAEGGYIEDRSGLRAVAIGEGTPLWPANVKPMDDGTLVQRDSHAAQPSPNGAISPSDWIGVIDGFVLSVDRQGEGRIRWARRLEELVENELVPCTVTAPLQTNQGTVVVSLSWGIPLTQSRLVSLLSDGTVQWRSPVLNALPVGGGGFTASLLAAGKSIFWSPDGVQMFSVNASDGAFNWTTSLTHGVEAGSTGPSGDANWASSYVTRQGKLLITRGHSLLSLDSETGTLLWERRFSRAAGTVVGETAGIAVLAAENLHGIDIQSGQVVWQAGDAGWNRVPPRHGKTPAVIIRNTILWGRGGEIWTVNARTGQALQRVSLRDFEQDSPESLVFSGNVLIVATSRQATAFRVLLRSQ